MFVLYELHSKDKKDKRHNQDKRSRTDEVQRTKETSLIVSLRIFPGASTVQFALGLTQPLKMSTRIFLGVKA
jgi:hypothetical protein